jgi:hypothetical protein
MNGLEVITSGGVDGGGIETKLSGEINSYSTTLFDPNVMRFLGPHLDILFDEYKITGLMTHCFDTLVEHRVADDAASTYHDDTHAMMVRDQKGNSLTFQKYFNDAGNYMLVTREIEKIKDTNGVVKGGKFEVCIYRLGYNPDGTPNKTLDTEPQRFYDANNRLAALGKATVYMKTMVDYLDAEFHDWDVAKCRKMGLDVQGEGRQRAFSLGIDNSFVFPFEYQSDHERFEQLHEDCRARLQERVDTGLLNPYEANVLGSVLMINYSRLIASLSKGQRIPEYTE